jgi:lipoprotein NlpI
MLRLTKQAFDLPSNKNAEKIELYTQAIEEDPTYYLPWTNRAACYINYGQWDKAIEDGSQAISLAPESPHPWNVRGRAYAGKREFAKAFVDLSRALELAETTEDLRNLYNERGNAYFSARDYAKAIKDYEQVIKISPEFAKGWNNLGITYRALGDLDEAYLKLDQAHRLDPNSARILMNRGRVYVARNDQLMARADFDKSVELDTADAAAWIDLGMFQYLMEEYQDARGSFITALTHEPGNPYAAVWRYLAHSSLDLKEDARVQLQSYAQGREVWDLWPMPIVQLFLGQITPEQLLQEAEKTDGEQRLRERRAEAHFYIAQHFRLQQDSNKRKEHLSSAVEQKVPRVQEFVMAKIMLDGWKDPLPPPPRPVPAESKLKLR